jgi:hypothetical protein
MVADATQIEKNTFSIPALRGRAELMPTLRVEIRRLTRHHRMLRVDIHWSG